MKLIISNNEKIPCIISYFNLKKKKKFTCECGMIGLDANDASKES